MNAVSDLPFVSATNGWGPVEKDQSNGGLSANDGDTITLNGVQYAKGLGVNAVSDITYNLNGAYTSFLSDIGVEGGTLKAWPLSWQSSGDLRGLLGANGLVPIAPGASGAKKGEAVECVLLGAVG